MSALPGHMIPAQQKPPSNAVWMRHFLVALTILAWAAIAAIAMWIIGLIATPIMYMIISIIIAYILYPLVKLFQRFMPRAVAILVTYIIVLLGLLLIIYYVLFTAVAQLVSLIQTIQKNLPTIITQLKPVVDFLDKVGISPEQFQISGQKLLTELLNVTSNLLPLVGSIFTLIISCIIITSVSIYFLIDGARVPHWLERTTPLQHRDKVKFFFTTLDRTMGNLIRGQITVAVITTSIVGLGLLIMGVPYVMLLMIIVFLFEFVPQIGAYISGGIIIIFAFITKGWQIGLAVAIFCSLVQGGLDGQVLIPRILGKAVGLHTIVAVFALLVGATLFGLPGAVFAAPVVGMAQILFKAYWNTWKLAHPDQFPEEQTPNQQPTGVELAIDSSNGSPNSKE